MGSGPQLIRGPSRVSPSPDQGQWGGKENNDSHDEYINGEISPAESRKQKAKIEHTQTQPAVSHIFGRIHVFSEQLNTQVRALQ